MNKTYAAGLAAFAETKTRSNSVFLSKIVYTFIFVLSYVLSYGQCVDPNLMSFSGNAPNSPTEICIGTEVTFTITGDLNGADRWVVFRGSCGGTIVGESTTNIITFTLEETNTYFVAGIDGCVSTPSCLNISFTVVDNTLPTALCQNITVFLDGSGNAVIDSNAVDNGSSDNCDIDRFELNQATFDCIDVSNSPITLTQTVFDASGNFSSCTANATVCDTVSPVAICQDITVFLDGAGSASIVSDDIDNGSSDACGIGNLSANPTSFNCSNLGFNTSTLTVTDVNNNSSMCTANVTVEDTAPPLFCPDDFDIFLDVNGNATIDAVNLSRPAEMRRDTFLFTGDLQSFTVPNGVTEVSIEGNGGDGGPYLGLGGNGASLSADFSVNANEELQLVVGGVAQGNGGGGGTFIARGSNSFMTFQPANTLLIAGAGGGAGGNGAMSNPVFSGGSSTVLQNGADGGGGGGGFARGAGGGATLLNNGNSGTFSGGGTAIILGGSAGGVFNSGGFGGGGDGASPWGGGGGGGASGGQGGIGFAADGNRASTGGTSFSAGTNTSAITPNPSDDGNGFVVISYILPAILEGDVTLSQSTFTCTDLGDKSIMATRVGENCTSLCDFMVTVRDTVSPVARCQNITVFLDASGNAVIDSNAVDNGSSDNCDIDRFVLNQATFDCMDVNSPITVTQTVYDASGNFSSCTANATVRDTVSPAAICQDITVFLDGAGSASIVSDDINNGSSDACGSVDLSATPSVFNCSNLGFNTSTLTVTDVNNNSSMCTANVTLRDTVSPVARCQDITVFLDGSGSAVIDSNALDNGSSDNCDIDRFDLNQSSFTCADISNSPITVQQAVYDASENSASCTASVTLRDTVSPVAICQDITVFLDGSGSAVIDSNAVDNGSSDNCEIDRFELDQSTFTCTDVINGPVTVTQTVFDQSGLSTTCTAAVTVGSDTDGDGICDPEDTDDDNDGVNDDNDPFRLSPNLCGDADGDGCDDCSIGTDGFGPLADNNPDNDGTDTDGDGICDMGDSCINFPGQIGDPCDDGNEFTEGDIINGNCECVGPIEIPTLSQWSILFLCLTMVIFGVVVVKFSLPEHLKEYFYE